MNRMRVFALIIAATCPMSAGDECCSTNASQVLPPLSRGQSAFARKGEARLATLL